MNWDEIIYKIFSYTYLILYVVILFGVWKDASYYYTYIDNYLKIVISIILIYYFNPITPLPKCTLYLQDVIFSSAIYLILSSTMNTYISYITNKGKNTIQHYMSPYNLLYKS